MGRLERKGQHLLQAFDVGTSHIPLPEPSNVSLLPRERKAAPSEAIRHRAMASPSMQIFMESSCTPLHSDTPSRGISVPASMPRTRDAKASTATGPGELAAKPEALRKGQTRQTTKHLQCPAGQWHQLAVFSLGKKLTGLPADSIRSRP